jgi:hypothetical protein
MPNSSPHTSHVCCEVDPNYDEAVGATGCSEATLLVGAVGWKPALIYVHDRPPCRRFTMRSRALLQRSAVGATLQQPRLTARPSRRLRTRPASAASARAMSGRTSCLGSPLPALEVPRQDSGQVLWRGRSGGHRRRTLDSGRRQPHGSLFRPWVRVWVRVQRRCPRSRAACFTVRRSSADLPRIAALSPPLPLSPSLFGYVGSAVDPSSVGNYNLRYHTE